MKVTLLKTMCGPDGNGFPGTVLDVEKDRADELIRQHAAREYDHEKDRAARRGLEVAKSE